METYYFKENVPGGFTDYSSLNRFLEKNAANVRFGPPLQIEGESIHILSCEHFSGLYVLPNKETLGKLVLRGQGVTLESALWLMSR